MGCHQNNHAFRVVAFLGGVETFDGIAVAGVAADAPDGVGRVEEGFPVAQGGDRLLDGFFKIHGAKVRKKSVTACMDEKYFVLLHIVNFTKNRRKAIQ